MPDKIYDAISMFQRHEQIPLADSNRGVIVCSLKKSSDPGDFVLYCSDGQCTALFAQQFYLCYPKAPVWFVGVNCSSYHRNSEYVIGRDNDRFGVHESFFVDTLLRWTEKTIGIKHHRDRAAVFGYSCGGAFAASMGIRNPETYATIFAFSVAGRPVQNFGEQPRSDISKVTFYFRSGSREPGGMQKYMKRLEEWLARFGACTSYSVIPGGHEFALWCSALNETLPRALLKGSSIG